MRTLLVGGFACFAFVGIAATQDVAEGLATAQQEIEAKEWRTALDVLLSLRQRATTLADVEVIARQLCATGEGLQEEAAFEPALRAHDYSLALRKRVNGDSDHADVATSMNRVGLCLQSLGQTDRAL